MNGATAVPLVSTMRPPKNASTIKIGSNQNFLRVRRNAQNSRRNETIIKDSELVLESVRGRARRLARYPVRINIRLESQTQDVLARQTHDPTYRSDAKKEDERKHDGTDHFEQQESELRP